MNMNRNIYLNDFRPSIIFRVIETLLDNDKELIIADNQGLSLIEAQDCEHLTLFYETMLHRLIIKPLWLYEPLFENPNCICEIASLQEFVKAVQPSKEFRQLMSSK